MAGKSIGFVGVVGGSFLIEGGGATGTDFFGGYGNKKTYNFCNYKNSIIQEEEENHLRYHSPLSLVYVSTY